MKKPEATSKAALTRSLQRQLQKLLAAGTDNALLRFSLGDACLSAGEIEQATTHLAAAVALAPRHSASWKLYGKALAQAGDPQAAGDAYHQGIQIAESNGDLQAAAEMRVFLRRLRNSPRKNDKDPR